MIISIPKLRELVIQAIQTQYTLEESELMAEVVMYGEAGGRKSHGLLRLMPENYGVFIDQERKAPEYIRKTPLSTIIKSHNNPGMMVGQLALQEIITLAQEHGIGIVSIIGYRNSTGAVSYYSEKLARAGFISQIYTGTGPVIAAFGAKKPILGTNPVAYGFPADPDPLVFDMSTSAIAYGDIAKAKIDGKELPENVAIDAEGNPTRDPAKAIEGATVPFDRGYKGSGLALMVELFGSVLPGAGFAGLHTELGNGVTMIAFSPDILLDISTFKSRMKELIDHLTSIETDTGTIRLPGFKTIETYKQNMAKGEIEVNDEVMKYIQNLIDASNA